MVRRRVNFRVRPYVYGQPWDLGLWTFTAVEVRGGCLLSAAFASVNGWHGRPLRDLTLSRFPTVSIACDAGHVFAERQDHASEGRECV